MHIIICHDFGTRSNCSTINEFDVNMNVQHIKRTSYLRID